MFFVGFLVVKRAKRVITVGVFLFIGRVFVFDLEERLVFLFVLVNRMCEIEIMKV